MRPMKSWPASMGAWGCCCRTALRVRTLTNLAALLSICMKPLKERPTWESANALALKLPLDPYGTPALAQARVRINSVILTIIPNAAARKTADVYVNVMPSPAMGLYKLHGHPWKEI